MTALRSSGFGAAVRGPFPLVLLLPAVIVLAAASLTPSREFSSNQGDVGLYFDNARAVVAGDVPYRDVSLEYPPLALVPMVVPYLAGLAFGPVTLDGYRWLFAGWEAFLVLLLGLVLLAIVRRAGASARPTDPAWTAWDLAWRLALLVGGSALAIAWRFDLFAALLLAVALWATLVNRPIAAGVALGLGVLAKLFPIAAAPALAFAWLVPRDDRRVLGFAIALGSTIVVGLLPFVIIAGGDALSFLGYQARRGLEIESVGAGVVLLDGLLRGQTVETASPFKAVEVFGPFARAWLGALPVLTLAGFGALAAGAWRRGRVELRAFGRVEAATLTGIAGASVLVLLVTSKVFSIQYVAWLVPFAALLSGWKFWLAAVAVALTMPIHPFLFANLVEQQALPVLVLNLRNALLVALTMWVIVDLWRAPAPMAAREG